VSDDLDREVELAWCAGFFDGEGSTVRKSASGTNRAQIELGISQNDRRVLDRFAAAVGAGRIGGPYGHRLMFQYRLGGYDAVLAAMVALWPYLGEQKQEQFRSAVQWLYEQGGPGRRGSSLCHRPGHTRRWTKRGLICGTCAQERQARSRKATG
jgi:hypothetical protein